MGARRFASHAVPGCAAVYRVAEACAGVIRPVRTPGREMRVKALFRRKGAPVWSNRPVGRGLRFPAGDLEMEVTGLSRHATAVDALVAACADADQWVGSVTVRLVREPDNPQDGNAVAVYADPHGLVGYLDRDDARTFGPLLDEHVRFTRTPVDLVATARLVSTLGEAGRRDAALTLLLPQDLGTRPL